MKPKTIAKRNNERPKMGGPFFLRVSGRRGQIIKEVRGYRPGGIFVVVDMLDKERLIRFDGGHWIEY